MCWELLGRCVGKTRLLKIALTTCWFDIVSGIEGDEGECRKPEEDAASKTSHQDDDLSLSKAKMARGEWVDATRTKGQRLKQPPPV